MFTKREGIKIYKLGLYEKSMPDITFLQKLTAAKNAGYDWMEISIDETEEKLSRIYLPEKEQRTFLRDIETAGLPVLTMCLSAHRKYPLGGHDARSMEIMEKAISFAKLLGIKIIQLAGYDVYYEPSTEETVKTFGDNLLKAAQMAEQAGITLAFETMETSFMNTASKALEWVKKTESKSLCIYPDVGNITNSGVDAVRDLQSCRGFIAAAHLKETKPGIFRDLEFGEGHVNFPLAVSELLSQGVSLYNLEFWYDGHPGWYERLVRNRKFFDRIFNQIGAEKEAKKPMNYYLGLDNGGSLSKAALFDQNGKEIAVSSEAVPLISPTERDMNELWESCCACIKDCIEKSKIEPMAIKGMAISGHGKGLYLWGKDNKPAYNGIVSTDQRAQEIVDALSLKGVTEKLREKSCQQLLACQPAALLVWMQKNRPDVYKNIKYVFENKDYIRFRLTGNAAAEITDYSGTSLLNLHTAAVDPEMFDILGIPEMTECIPPIVGSFDVCGHITEEISGLTGLPKGMPVFGGMFDINACALAMDVTSPEDFCTITGTWSINEYAAKAMIPDGKIDMHSIYCMSEYYLIEDSSPSSCSNLEWFKNTFFEKLSYKELDEIIAKMSEDSSEVLFYPHIFLGGGRFSGLMPDTTKYQMLKAVYEGIVFAARVHIEKLLSTRGRPEKIKLAGGAANSPVWVQMYADILGFPIEVMEAKELGALGAAIAAAYGAEEYGSISEAAAAMSCSKGIIFPNSEKTEKYQQKYKKYIEGTL